MDQRERALLAGLPEVGYAAGVPGWDGLWQNAVGRSMGRDGASVTHVDEGVRGEGLLATIWAELTR
jgi:hypothetical protein